jgi:hypothetical protein
MISLFIKEPVSIFSLLSIIILFIGCSDNSKTNISESKLEKNKVDIIDEDTKNMNCEKEIRKRLEKWNNAHNTKDAASFTDLYYNQVYYYNDFYSLGDCVQKKLSDLDTNQSYEQYIADEMKFEKLTDDRFKCIFNKKQKVNERTSEITSFLIFKKFERHWYIITEGDTIISAKQ